MYETVIRLDSVVTPGVIRSEESGGGTTGSDQWSVVKGAYHLQKALRLICAYLTICIHLCITVPICAHIVSICAHLYVHMWPYVPKGSLWLTISGYVYNKAKL